MAEPLVSRKVYFRFCKRCDKRFQPVGRWEKHCVNCKKAGVRNRKAVNKDTMIDHFLSKLNKGPVDNDQWFLECLIELDSRILKKDN